MFTRKWTNTWFLVFLMTMSFAYAHECNEDCEEGCQQEYCQNNKKHYCSPEQIEINDSAILILLGENVCEIDNLLVDQGGLYFHENSLRCFECRRPINRPINPRHVCEYPHTH